MKILVYLFSGLRYLIILLIALICLGLVAPYIQNIQSYNHLRTLLHYEQTINQSVKHYVPTRIVGYDLSRIFSVLVLLMLLGILEKMGKRTRALVYRRSQKKRLQVSADFPSAQFSEKRETGTEHKKTDSSEKSSLFKVISSNLVQNTPEIKKINFTLPPLSFLKAPEPVLSSEEYKEETENTARQIEYHMEKFDLPCKVVDVYRGPVVTRYEILPEAGIKGASIASLPMDLARVLSVPAIRVVEMVSGKSVVGLEIPNATRDAVYLREILSSPQYKDENTFLPLALGKNITGESIILDLAKTTHVMIAGTSGSGKSICINSLIVGLIYKNTPEKLRLILIDPKVLEFSVYQGIPHLLTPVVTDPQEAIRVLQWCVDEMEARYQLMSTLQVRNIVGYNNKIKEAEKKGDSVFAPKTKEEKNPAKLTSLPYIVIIVDEFADLMMLAGGQIEQSIARIAQKARAAGIHLIIATQRASEEVITGLIKANIPNRVSFQVASKDDSMMVINQPGAEQLLGNGDMFFLPPATGIPMRLQGAFVSDPEVSEITEHWKKQGHSPIGV